MINRYAIIVAGGSGSRMNSETPKQFLLLRNRPILMHTILAFYEYSSEIKIILVLPKASETIWKQLCHKYEFTHDILQISGGDTRYHSVKNGLNAISDPDGYVAVHDGVRPLVRPEIIKDSFEFAIKNGSAIASTPLKESLRKIDGMTTMSVDRSSYRLIQTPQTFNVKLIKDAYNAISYNPELTDDASVVERFGHPVKLFDGDYSNIKITTPDDLIFAQAVLANKKGDM